VVVVVVVVEVDVVVLVNVEVIVLVLVVVLTNDVVGVVEVLSWICDLLSVSDVKVVATVVDEVSDSAVDAGVLGTVSNVVLVSNSLVVVKGSVAGVKSSVLVVWVIVEEIIDLVCFNTSFKNKELVFFLSLPVMWSRSSQKKWLLMRFYWWVLMDSTCSFHSIWWLWLFYAINIFELDFSLLLLELALVYIFTEYFGHLHGAW
jgi:hypothetical protein